MISIAQAAQNAPNFEQAVSQAQSLFEKLVTVTGDTLVSSNSSIPGIASFRATVTSVTQILAQGLPQWQEQASLDAVRLQSGLSKESFSAL
ncbi:MAG TPA: hypothetical protein DEV81_12380, partial [Cyanobacteria bacterium UBA11049]|nr:hypothetical protein [Cyanobacteria bacterium UBA11049]